MMGRIVTTVLALTFVVAGPATAQLPGIEISPYVGGYIPVTDLVDEQDIDLTASHKEAFAFGGRVGVNLPGPLGVEGSFLYALSDLESDDQGEVVDTDAAVWAASGKLIYEFGLPAAPVSFNVNGGLALIGRTGDAYENADETTDVGGVVGAGLQVGLPGLWSIRFDVEDYLYSFQAEGEPGEEFDSQFQNDVVISAGVVWTLGIR